MERQSNIELLRLVCMFFIIWLHFTGFGIFVLSERYANETGFASLFPQLIHGCCQCAVDTFILISGFFSIRPKAKSFFNLYLVCAFYAGLLFLLHVYLSGSHFNRWCIYNTLLPFGLWKSSTNWWFIPNYLMLYIISPILNRVVEKISKRQFLFFLFLMSIPVFYFGWYRNMSFAENGYNIFNFIFLYFIGRYIALFCNRLIHSRLLFMGGWLILGIVMGVTSEYVHLHEKGLTWMWYLDQYNSPVCVASAVFLFCAFNSIKIQNKIVNWYSASALSIYLLHDNSYVAKPLGGLVHTIYDTYHFPIAYLLLLFLSLALMGLIPIVDKLRIMVTAPISKVLCVFWDILKPKVVSLFSRI